MQDRTRGTGRSHAIVLAVAAAATMGIAHGSDADGGTSDSAGSCDEPASCPAPDAGKPPEVTCHRPTSHTIESNPTLHIYGRHLIREGEPPVRLIYRNDEASGTAGRTNDEVEVESACHVAVELYIAAAPSLRAGSTVEFRLLRDPPTEEMIESNEYGEVATDWYEVEITE